MAISKTIKRNKVVGKRVVPTHDIINRYGNVLSKGTICTIIDTVKGRGLTIETDRCPHCGQYTRLSGVKREDVDFYNAEVHNNIFLPKQVRILLNEISFFLNEVNGFEFALKRNKKEEYTEPNDWYYTESKIHNVTDEEIERYRDKYEAFKFYKKIEELLGR